MLRLPLLTVGALGTQMVWSIETAFGVVSTSQHSCSL